MKRIIPIVIVLLAVAGIGYSFIAPELPSSKGSTQTGDAKVASGTSDTGGDSSSTSPGVGGPGSEEDSGDVLPEDASEGEVRPATEVFKSSDEALEAVKKASIDYDDIVLEQFTQLGEDCSWCPEFYKGVKDLMKGADVKPDQKSYYAELLAISGRVDNVKSLIESMKGASKPEDREIYSEALELVLGKDDVVDYLGKQLTTDNAEMKDAIVAAITNQGSVLAVDTLYKNTVESGDPDGFYSQGIGLGELIPDEEAVPKLREIVQKRDPYSHLAVKALLNSGLNGLRTVMDVLANSPDADFDRKMLKDAVDHVNYEEDVEKYLKETMGTSKSPVVQEFAKQILDDFNAQDQEEAEGAGDGLQSVDQPAAN